MQSELRGMEAMVEAFRAMGSQASSRLSRKSRVSTSTKGGRQPGTITKTWLQTLEALILLEGRHFSVGDVISTVKAIHARELRPSEVRRIFQGYAGYGYVEIEDNDHYRLTDSVIERYHLPTSSSSDAAQNAADETEAPNSDAAGAPVSSGWGAPTPLPVWINPQT